MIYGADKTLSKDDIIRNLYREAILLLPWRRFNGSCEILPRTCDLHLESDTRNPNIIRNPRFFPAKVLSQLQY